MKELYGALYIQTDFMKKIMEEKYDSYMLYTYLLRNGYQHNFHSLSLVYDLWNYFYFKDEELVLHPEHNLIYGARSMALKLISGDETMQRLKVTTLERGSESMLAAIYCTNLFIDQLQNYCEVLPEETQRKIKTYMSFDIGKLFSEQFKQVEPYPSLFVELQAKVIKEFYQNKVKNEGALSEQLMEISKLIREFHLRYEQTFSQL
ncbi:hypothetical protein [Lysinibacillus odysseyi]|uniref:Uncharacterized protein n=1 Tax=Lysinibacillus odysseyi 34hs-1 = NBRC 100172 TaxID=1220589 RepID=A0A0A3JJR0_9BACI|nr:hypothetical protein [Lysinibacillus odysseyi]KGR87227.1 hypothetical protein CD32_04145 [Lysinibacillus odysseyi 34hs-1 = NBRC 100172]